MLSLMKITTRNSEFLDVRVQQQVSCFDPGAFVHFLG